MDYVLEMNYAFLVVKVYDVYLLVVILSGHVELDYQIFVVLYPSLEQAQDYPGRSYWRLILQALFPLLESSLIQHLV